LSSHILETFMLLRSVIFLLALAGAALPATAQQLAPAASTSAISMAPLRRLMEQRLALMPDVARHKWNTGGAIDDLPREQKIIEDLSAQAQMLGVPGKWAEQFFRAQIEGAKQVQRACFVRWQQSGAGKFANVPDLVTVIRPRLDALTPQLLRELAVAWPALADPDQQERIATEMAKLDHGTPEAAASVTRPLIDGSAHVVAPSQK
jgi:chorismate mutase